MSVYFVTATEFLIKTHDSVDDVLAFYCQKHLHITESKMIRHLVYSQMPMFLYITGDLEPALGHVR